MKVSVGDEVFSMEELEDHKLSVLAFPLRSHVSHAVDSSEVEVVGIGDGVARDLAVSGPWLPARSDRPFERFDPSASSNGGHDSIGIARVVHEGVPVSLQDSVDPD